MPDKISGSVVSLRQMVYFLYYLFYNNSKINMEHATLLGGGLWIWVIFIGFTLLSWLISHRLKSRFEKYSKIPTANGMTGRDVVEK
ncbi:MAG: zinc metallopeptidase, partial [Odoribacter sp.]